MGKPIPETLIRQMEEDKRKELEEDSFNNFSVDKGDEENETNEKALYQQQQIQMQQQELGLQLALMLLKYQQFYNIMLLQLEMFVQINLQIIKLYQCLQVLFKM